MPCYRPLKGFRIGVWPQTGKPKYKICSKNVDHLEDYTPVFKEAVVNSKAFIDRDWIPIPCGHCLGCRLDYSLQWANRCMLELQYHDESWFVTLTYNDDNVPYLEHYDGSRVYSLCHKDVQDFLKRLRKGNETEGFPPQDIRYYGCGEYGDNGTLRPHYHLIIYGLHLDMKELEPYKFKNGYWTYKCPYLAKIWRKGFVVVGHVTWESCAYTARYMLKKQYGRKIKMLYDSCGIDREYTMMSRRPGIAAQYYKDHKDQIYEYDSILIKKGDDVKEIKPPRYFDKMFDIEDPNTLDQIKENRKMIAESTMERAMKETGKSYFQYLADLEEEKVKKIKSLRRNYENGKTKEDAQA